jgi:hypothetical protein
MRLRYDPYRVFVSSRSPAGLYARQKWLNESSSAAWQEDFKQTVAALYAGQSADGSWEHSVLETIRRLFGLHLTVREPDANIDAALGWLMQQVRLPPSDDKRRPKALPPESLAGLPFAGGRRDLCVSAAGLFLSSIFGKSQAPRVVEHYQQLVGAVSKDQKLPSDLPTLCNVLRALVVHPQFSQHRFTDQVVAALTGRQGVNGEWEPPIPFYQTVNALAHLESTRANAQLEKAFRRLVAVQNTNGSWSADQPEWHTFLVVHALRNKALI